MWNELRKRKNTGMTVIEIFIVIALLSILASGSVSMVGVLTGQSARKATTSITSMLSEAKVKTMGRSKKVGQTAQEADIYLQFEKREDKCVAVLYQDGKELDNPVDLTDRRIEVSAVLAEGIDDSIKKTAETVTDVFANNFRVAFNRKDGSLLPNDTYSDQEGNKIILKYVKQIVIKQGERKTLRIYITPATGKIRDLED